MFTVTGQEWSVGARLGPAPHQDAPHVYDLVWGLIRLAIASLITGAGLSLFDVGPDEALATIGLTREEALALIGQAFDWAIPNMILGASVIIPLWFVVWIFRPPRAH